MADSLRVSLMCFHDKVRVTITLPGLDLVSLNKSTSLKERISSILVTLSQKFSIDSEST